MFTLGYSFRPWTDAKAIADGAVDPAATSARPRASTASTSTIRFGHRVVRADWSTDDARWTVDGRAHRHRRDRAAHLRLPVRAAPATTATTRATRPSFAGRERFDGPDRAPAALARGPRLRRQAGRGDRQRRDRGDAGAGAGRARRARDDAAALADATSSRCPARDPIADAAARACCRRRLRLRARALEERRCSTTVFYQLSRRRPELIEALICARASSASCPPGYDVDTHFTPRYNPWDQRLCLVPDGDLFEAIRDGTRVGRHRPHRDVHRDGHPAARPASELEADVIVTATGLNLLLLGGIELVGRRRAGRPRRDGRPTRA